MNNQVGIADVSLYKSREETDVTLFAHKEGDDKYTFTVDGDVVQDKLTADESIRYLCNIIHSLSFKLQVRDVEDRM